MADAEQPFAELDWDSQFFGKRIGCVMSPLPSRAALDELLDRARGAGIDCLYCLVDPQMMAMSDALQGAGFGLIDVRLVLEAPTRLDPAAAARTRAATAHDVPRLREIASRCHHDARFYSDRRFPRELCDAFYATWIERSVLHAFADRVLTIDADDGAAGYVTCSKQADGSGSIGLFAVAEQARGRGHGRQLLASALDWFARQGITRARVVTQGRNAAAQRLYQRLGFVTGDAKLWYHLWLAGDARL